MLSSGSISRTLPAVVSKVTLPEVSLVAVPKASMSVPTEISAIVCAGVAED
jgi:hypothetical protein